MCCLRELPYYTVVLADPPSPYHRRSFFFFFSSRRRHTRSLCDWSSDVCSSDLNTSEEACLLKRLSRLSPRSSPPALLQRSEERRVGKSVDLGGRRIIKKKKKKNKTKIPHEEMTRADRHEV